MSGSVWTLETNPILELFDGYRIERIANRREINLKSASRDITELLIMNY